MTCIVDGCDRDVFVKSRGFCKVHYARWWKHGDPNVVKPPGIPAQPRPVCRYAGCENLSGRGTRGWCGKHHTRWYRHGDPSIDGNRFRKRTPVFTRILDKLSVGGFDQCWEWQGARLPNGYGLLGVDNGERYVNRYVHRLTYEHFRGPIPDGLHLHHTCEVKACANPQHLVPVTRLEHASLHRQEAA